jgi:hypothetical protein
VFSKSIEQSEIRYYRDIYKVISTQLKGGKLHIRVLSPDTEPEDGFVSAVPNLEDVYFSTISSRVDVNTI